VPLIEGQDPRGAVTIRSRQDHRVRVGYAELKVRILLYEPRNSDGVMDSETSDLVDVIGEIIQLIVISKVSLPTLASIIAASQPGNALDVS
jgi:hypothetical protein